MFSRCDILKIYKIQGAESPLRLFGRYKMDYRETLMWKEINETPRIFGEIQQANRETMDGLVKAIKDSKATNFVAAARGTSDHALIYFKYIKIQRGRKSPLTIREMQNGLQRNVDVERD